MAYTVANAAFTTLTSELGPSDLTLNVASTTAFPAVPFVVTLLPASGTASYEFIIIDSNKTATTLVASATSKRYQNGSSAGSGLTWPVGSRVRLDVDELFLEELRTDVDAKVPKSTVTTAGDLIYGTASATVARLGIGTARQVLATNSGATAPEWVASLQSLMTAQGDIVYASAANTPARLAKGTATQVLRMNSGATAPEWATHPAYEVISIPAAGFGAIQGSPSFASIYSTTFHSAWLFDAAADETVGAGGFVLPAGWTTLDIDIWWTNTAGGAGNVQWVPFFTAPAADGGALNVAGAGSGSTVAVGTALAVKKTTLHSGLSVTAGNLLSLTIQRDADNAADTYASDVALLAAVLRKAS